MTRTVLVTGGNRGIGLATGEALGRLGMRVVVGARDPQLGDEAAAGLRAQGIDALTTRVDIGDPDSVAACAAALDAAGVQVDVLVNNAGEYIDGDLLTVAWSEIERSLRVNFLGHLWMCRAFVPGMLARGYGRVVNVSSTSGQIADRLCDHGPYALAKASLNALTVRLAYEADLARADVKVNTMCPGWVATRMGTAGAPRTPEQGADTVVWLATLPADGPTGGFFADRAPIPW